MANDVEFEVDSLSEFLGYVQEEKERHKEDFIFRGQRMDKPLLPRLARLELPQSEILDLERLIFEEFRRTCPSLTELAPATDWDFLSLAQHHRLPTRLLDWTYSALAALWFAVETRPIKENGTLLNGVVWLLRTTKEDFIGENDRESPFQDGVTRIYRPRVINRRIAAQGGLFTVHRVMKDEGFVAFEKNRHFRGRRVKFVIKPQTFASLREQLHSCGVNRFSLFPDLEGLCSHLRWRYFERTASSKTKADEKQSRR